MPKTRSRARSARFDLGSLYATPGALERIEAQSRVSMMSLIARHACGDWGDVCDKDARLNDQAVDLGGRILSSYNLDSGRIWIITEADRSATTILTPEEY